MFLGIDIGTTAVKALVINAEGETLAAAAAEIPSHYPGPGLHEQEPDEIWRALKTALAAATGGIDKSRLRAACFSSAMHGLIALDRKRRPLSRLITWADGRGGPFVSRLRERVDAFALYSRTGCPLQPLYYPAKLAWFKERAPDLFQKAAFFCGGKELILQRLCGRLIMDQGIASSIGLLDLQRLSWDAEALALCGIGPENLPALVSPRSVIEGLDKNAAAELGLPKNLLLVPGSGDGGLANLGSAAIFPGRAAVTIGASGALRVVSKKPALDPGERTWCYFLSDGFWFAGGAINSGGLVYRWVRDGLYPDLVKDAQKKNLEPYEIINEEAEKIAAGADGLIMLPYLMGERTPHWDPRARGVIFGLTPAHGRAHLARAALEGTCFAMRDVMEALLAAGLELSELRASGGFMRSRLWLQLLADVLGRPVSVPAREEGSARGAAFLAMLAAGRLKGLEEVDALAPVERLIRPDPARQEIYERSYSSFKSLYPRLKEQFNRG